MYWCKSLLSCLERNDFASFAGLTFAYLQIFWPAQCLDSLTVHKVDRQCIFGLDKRPTKVGCKEARHGGCWDDVSQQLSNFHRTAYLDFCRCHGCIFSRGEYMSKKKIWNCLSLNLGILKLSVLINQNIFKTVYQNFQKHNSISLKQCRRWIFLVIPLGWFLFWWSLEFWFWHAAMFFPLLHWFQNCFCFRSRTFPSHVGTFLCTQADLVILRGETARKKNHF